MAMEYNYKHKCALAQMLKNGVIMDVTNAEQAVVAEKSGAVAVMALERVPADIRVQGGVARMSAPEKIIEIKKAVTVPVMAKARIGHFMEAKILEALKVDYIDESEVLTPADPFAHIEKHKFRIPFVCGARNLGEALRRITEGAAMIRTKGEAGTGNIVEAVRHIKTINEDIKKLKNMNGQQIKELAKEYRVPEELVKQTSELGRMPVVNFAAGGIASPADAALCMELGVDGVFVGSGIFKSGNPSKMAEAIVKAVLNYNDPEKLAEASFGIGDSMKGLDIEKMDESEKLAGRGI